LTPLFIIILALAAAGLAYGVARVATAPLRRLSKAAVDLGRDLNRPPLAVEGPSEVRSAAEAFNIMQVRLKRDLAERTHMLAAITHDLQTPMTRLRLRLEKVPDEALREQLLADQEAMLTMIREGLDLARASGEVEPLQELDIDSLLHSLCEDACDAGADVAITARCDCSVPTRPQALRRCVSNLLDNALKYAGAAELSAVRLGEAIQIRVVDHGPGIPPDRIEAMMEPFVRMESSRSRETGGVGLGLTIARILAERAGGTLELKNRPSGGLEALVRLRNGLPTRSGSGAVDRTPS
jgi:signal transduction histidine kinase